MMTTKRDYYEILGVARGTRMKDSGEETDRFPFYL